MELKQMKFNVGKIVARSPRLETVLMVENFIKENSGEYKKTELFNSLPKKMIWGTFSVILKYLYETNHIGIDNEGFIVYIWNPEAYEKYINRKGY